MTDESIEWLIVGGGIHGVHIAARLLGETDLSPVNLRILDPGKQLLDRWNQSTARVGMTHLRSPSVHHLDLHPWSLLEFAEQKSDQYFPNFIPPFDRPNLSLFKDHSESVINHYELSDIHIQDKAVSCSLQDDGVLVQLSKGSEIKTNQIIFAIGSSEEPEWPKWAEKFDEHIDHIFDPNFKNWPTTPEIISVVGGGISAAQVALRLTNEGHEVHLVSRHSLRQHRFDSDPGWLGPKLMKKFNKVSCVNTRRSMISEARHKGSVPPDVYQALEQAIQNEQLYWYEDEIHSLNCNGSDLLLTLSNQKDIRTQRILLATGFKSNRPGGPMMDTLIKSASLPCAQCGYPIVDSELRWHPKIYVSGPLAELEIGPAARNIAGARRAGDRLVNAYKSLAYT